MGTALFPARAAAIATPTTQADCETKGGTWSSAYVGSTPPGCSIAQINLMTLDQQVQSYMFYRALGGCVAYDGNNLSSGVGIDIGARISQATAKSGRWFADFAGFSTATSGVYLDGASGVKANDAGNIDCSQAGLVTGALSLWNNWAPDEALCAFGFRMADDGEFHAGRCTNAQGGSDDFKRGSDITNSYKTAVKDRIYGGKEPSLSSAAKYLLYLKTFQRLCVPTAEVSTSKPIGSTDRDYAVSLVSGNGKDASIKTTYYTSRSNKAQSDVVEISPGSGFDTLVNADLKSCGDLAKAINGDNGKKNGLADAYVSQLQNSGEANAVGQSDKQCQGGATTDANGNPCPTTGGNVTTCAIDGIGWIICPVITFVAGLADSMFTVLSDNFLKVGVSVVNTDPSKGATTTYKAWQAMQAFANVILVIVFLLIIFSQMASIGLSNLSVKKMLPKLVIAAILMNLSFFLCQLAVDVSNIAGYGLKDFFTGIAATASSGSGAAIDAATGNVLGGTNGWANLAGGILAAGTVITAGYFMLSMLGTLLLAAVLALAMILLILVARQGIIVLAIVTAPVAIALWLLPNTQNIAQLWWKIFSRMLLLFPIISLIFGASTLAAVILRDSFGSFTAANGNVNWLGQIVAAGIQVMPLFATPLVLKGALNVVPGVGALASKWAGRANGNLGKQAREGYRSSVFGRGRAIRKQARQNFRDQRFADRISKGGASAFAAGGLSNLGWTKGQRAQREAIERAARGTAASAQSEAVKQEMVKLQEKIGTDPDAILRHIQSNHRSMSDTEMQGASDLMLAQAGTAQLRTVMSDPGIMQTHARNVVESARRNESTVRQKAPDLANWAARTEATAGAYGGQTIADTYAKAEAAKLVTLDPAAAEAGEAHINPVEAKRALNDVNASQIKQGTRKVLERLAANAAPSEPMPIPSTSAGGTPSSEQVYRNDRGDLSHDSTADYYQAAAAEVGGIHNLSDADVQIMHNAAEKWSITDDAGGGTAMTEIGMQALEELKRRGKA